MGIKSFLTGLDILQDFWIRKSPIECGEWNAQQQEQLHTYSGLRSRLLIDSQNNAMVVVPELLLKSYYLNPISFDLYQILRKKICICTTLPVYRWVLGFDTCFTICYDSCDSFGREHHDRMAKINNFASFCVLVFLFLFIYYYFEWFLCFYFLRVYQVISETS